MQVNFTSAQRLALLGALGNGRGAAIGAKPLAQLLNFPIVGNQVQLRSLIKECIEIHGDLIGASTGNPAGFFIISTLSELEKYLDSLENRTRSDNSRRSALITSWNNVNGNTNTTKTILTIT